MHTLCGSLASSVIIFWLCEVKMSTIPEIHFLNYMKHNIYGETDSTANQCNYGRRVKVITVLFHFSIEEKLESK